LTLTVAYGKLKATFRNIWELSAISKSTLPVLRALAIFATFRVTQLTWTSKPPSQKPKSIEMDDSVAF